MYPYPGHLSHFSFHQCQAIGPFSPPSKARVHDNSLSVDFIRDMLLDSGELDVSPEVSRLLPPETWRKTHCKTSLHFVFFGFSHFSLWFFIGKFPFSQVSRQVASATTGTGSKMATVVMLWCDLWTKGHHVSEGSALACVRHFCDGEVGHTGILGVEILGLCLSSKLCKLVFFGLETLTFWRSEKVKTFHIFSHHIWTESDIDRNLYTVCNFSPVKRRAGKTLINGHPHETRREALPRAGSVGDSPRRLFEGERREEKNTIMDHDNDFNEFQWFQMFVL